MPSYGGGKAKLGAEIADIIHEIELANNWDGDYFEPFCGLLGVGMHFAEDGRKVIACDANEDLILMLKSLQKGWTPPKTCSRDKYEKIKNSPMHSAERGFIGIACAYSGIFFAGYRMKDNNQDYFNNTRNGLINMNLENVKFLASNSYTKFEPAGMTIYCDPPYRGNTFKCEHFDDFDHDEFWDTMRAWSKNNLVIISEYTAPSDFKCVWSKKMKTTFNSTNKTKRIEKLFMLKTPANSKNTKRARSRRNNCK